MAFAYKRALTINHTKCGSASSSNFPFYFPGASYLATVGNGGGVQNASGYDIGFYADSALTTKLAWETVSWSASTGLGEWHIKVPTLSASADTVIYVAYGDATISTDESSGTSVWTSRFTDVHHMGGASLSLADSTTLGNTFAANTGVAAGAGKLGGQAASFSNSPSYFTLASGGLIAGYAARAISFWAKATPNGVSGSLNVWFDQWDGSTTNARLLHYTPSDITQMSVSNTSEGNNYANGSGTSAGASLDGNWHHYYFGVDTSVTQRWSADVAYYVDGVLQTRTGGYDDTVVANISGAGRLGAHTDGSAQYGIVGLIDEYRYENLIPTQSWVTATYNNQSSPSTFFATGAQQAATSLVASNALFWLGD